MEIVNIHQAKTHLSRLVERVSKGEEIIIGKSGKPVARLVPVGNDATPRKGGQWKGLVEIADDFDELPEDILGAFRGEQP